MEKYKYTMDEEELSDLAGLIMNLEKVELHETWVKAQRELSPDNVIDIFFLMCKNNKIFDLIKSSKFYDDSFNNE